MTAGEFDELADDVQTLGLDTFGEPITYHPDGGADVTVGSDGEQLRGVFRAQSAEATFDSSEVGHMGVLPVVVVKLTDVVAVVPKRDQVTVRGTRFTVKDSEPDGYGALRLVLQRGVSLP